MEISKLSANARIGEVSDVAKSILNAYETSTIKDDMTLKTVIAELKKSNNELVFAVEKDKAISKREEVDEERDKIIQNIFPYLEGSARIPDEITAKAATTILDIFKKYGMGIVKLSYGEESTQVNSLLGDLTTETAITNIANVPHLGVMIEQLRVAQANFETVYDEYTKQLSEDKSKQSASSIKPVTLKIINNRLVKYLNAQIEFNEEVFGAFARQVDVQIDKANEVIKERRSKK